MATTVLGLKTFAASDPVDYNEINDNYNKIDNGVKTALQGRAAYNLLDNSDFRNPVNQRGITGQIGGGYGLDRWRADGAGTITVGSTGVSLTNLSFRQPVQLKAGTYTLAFKVSNGTLLYYNFTYDGASTITKIGGANETIGAYINLYNQSNGVVVCQFVLGPEYTYTLVWAALYEGSYTADTLPAYQPKGYAAELAECQLYLYDPIIGGSANSTYIGTGFKINDTTIYFTVPIPTMRKTINTPTLTAKKISIFENSGNVIVPSELYVLGKITAGVATICARTNSALSAGKVYTLFATADDSSLQFSNDL